LDFEKSAVLIVDDDETICELVSAGLPKDSYISDIASTADEALTKLQKHCFDIILLDIRLPGKSGIEILREISSNGQNTAVIIMTAIHDIETAVETMKLGAVDYITKPFDLVRLEACLQTTLNNRGSDINKSQIEAIARGAQARVSGATISSIVSETVQIARRLGIDEGEIQKWAIARETQISKGIGGLILDKQT
jgi:DNA-binding NtrC family response regulator